MVGRDGAVTPVFSALLAACAAVILAVAPPALGASPSSSSPLAPSSPLSPGVPAPQAPAPTTTTPPVVTTTPGTGTTASGDNGLSGSNAVIIAVGALVILGGIAFFIWRDARRRAPMRARAAAAVGPDAGRSRPGSKQRGKPRKLSPAERRRRKRGRAR